MSVIAPPLERPRGRVPRPVLLAIAAAWALAVAAELTGAAGTLHHDALIEGGQSPWAALLFFLFAWQAMVAAMMLPSALPLIRLFDAVSGNQERPRQARVAFLGGYVAVWTGFGALALLGDAVVHRTVDALPWLSERPWLIAGSVLALADLPRSPGRPVGRMRTPASPLTVVSRVHHSEKGAGSQGGWANASAASPSSTTPMSGVKAGP